ncbi:MULTISPECIES: LacI family DNA-binding transcriptional regulator [Alicyclobacillaceae]|uniref:HTH lacI-type domain-containing protein n=1 Tax=Ferroacidibacillus organovorans TaxID=1765683 RepID=A0A1V4ETR5_9BACL|nr:MULTISPECIES: LacI family DNA-binding transcriptional regulator [Alicyclobacillaceae]OPG16048.1 hypothetical protein B2M26_08345 [Ferroacidibacillus organovorans]
MEKGQGVFTINEIARAAGVSRSTVSRVLTKHPNVKPSTRKLVEEVIQKLDYHPSPIAQGKVAPFVKTIFFPLLSYSQVSLSRHSFQA